MEQVAASLLSQTLNPSTQRNGNSCVLSLVAEQQLLQMAETPGFLPMLLQLASSPSLPSSVQLAASLFLKNQIKRRWPQDDLATGDREAIKNALISALLHAPQDALARQLGECIVIVAQQDFPQAWPLLIDQLLAPLQLEEVQPCLRSLRCIHHLTVRYRTEFRSDDLFREINLVLGSLAPAALDLYRGLLRMAKVRPAEQRSHYLRGVLLLNKILLSLCSQDLPAHVEDHLNDYYAIWQEQLELIEEGVKMVAVVGDIQVLFARRYLEDASTQLQAMLERVLTVLPQIVQNPEWERASASLLTFVSCSLPMLPAGSASVLIQAIIMPSLRLGEAELEQFEDEPLEWVRQDVERGVASLLGAGGEEGQRPSQRSAALGLARGLAEADTAAQSLLQQQLSSLLTAYQGNPAGCWPQKEMALHLFAAIAIRGSTGAAGVTKINEQVDVAAFFRSHLLPDLAPTNAACQALLKVAAIRHLLLFRSLLPAPLLMECLPLLLHHVASPHAAIHTYAAVCLERILQVRDKETRQPLFPAEQLAQALPVVAQAILSLLVRHPSAHNDHLMRALMRLVSMVPKEAVAQHATALLLPPLLQLLPHASGHPRFCHYWFETTVAIVVGCDGRSRDILDTQLLPALQGCLVDPAQQEAMAPYCLQLIAAMIEYRSGSEQEIPAVQMSLIQACLQPALWQQPSQIPPLVRLLQGALNRYPQAMATLLPTLLGIYQTLMANRVMDVHGLALLQSVLLQLPFNMLTDTLPPALVIMLRRLQQQPRPARLLRAALSCLMSWSIADAGHLWRSFEQCQAGLLMGLFRNVLMPEAIRMPKGKEKDFILWGLIKLVAVPDLLATEQSLQCWVMLVGYIVSLLHGDTSAAAGEEEVVEMPEEVILEDSLIQSGSYSRLLLLPPALRIPAGPADLQVTLIETIQSVVKEHGRDGRCQAALQSLEGGQLDLLRELFTRHGVKL